MNATPHPFVSSMYFLWSMPPYTVGKENPARCATSVNVTPKSFTAVGAGRGAADRFVAARKVLASRGSVHKPAPHSSNTPVIANLLGLSAAWHRSDAVCPGKIITFRKSFFAAGPQARTLAWRLGAVRLVVVPVPGDSGRRNCS